MLSILFTYYRKGVARYFRRDILAKSITVFLFIMVMGILAVLIHLGFYFGFIYLAKDLFFGEALSLYIIELFLLISSALVFTSAMVTGIVSLFRADESIVLLASPRFKIKPWMVFIRMFFSSLWPLLIVIIPALIAIVRVFPLSTGGFFLALFASVLLVYISVLAAMLILFIAAAGLHSVNYFSKKSLLIMNIGIFSTILWVIWERFHSINLADFFQARILTKDVPDFTPILSQFEIFPSHFVGMVIYYAEYGLITKSLISVGYLLILSIGFFLLFHYVTNFYLRLWQIAQEGKGVTASVSKDGSNTRLLAHAPGALSALYRKEWVLFIRNPRGMLWLGFIFIIWGIQSATSFLLVRGLGVERVMDSAVPLIAGAFQFALVAYFVSMLALRFAFPSFSQEQKTAWIIGSSPLALTEVFTAKLYFYVTIFCAIGLTFTAVNISIIGFHPLTTPLLFIMIMLSIITITILALSLGAIYPNTKTDDPELLSTTLPGLSFITASLLYGALGALIFRGYTQSGSITYAALFFVSSLCACLMLAHIAKSSLQTRRIL